MDMNIIFSTYISICLSLTIYTQYVITENYADNSANIFVAFYYSGSRWWLLCKRDRNRRIREGRPAGLRQLGAANKQTEANYIQTHKRVLTMMVRIIKQDHNANKGVVLVQKASLLDTHQLNIYSYL